MSAAGLTISTHVKEASVSSHTHQGTARTSTETLPRGRSISSSSSSSPSPSPPPASARQGFFKRVFRHESPSRTSSDSIEHPTLSPVLNTAARLSNDSMNHAHESLKEKYGRLKTLLGKGSNGSCYLVKRSSDAREFAVKEFRKRREGESEKDYMKKLTAEYCIGTLLHHENVVETIDIIFDKGHAYEVMELCGGGDLFEVISENTMGSDEINCVFTQLLHGVDYLHTMGICHRDLKPENCLFDSKNHLKIIDFGSADVVKTAYDSTCRKSSGRCGSGPYMAPEEFTNATYDGTKVDVWACAVIYLAMVFQRFPWQSANMGDANYKNYISGKCQCKFFEKLPEGPRALIKSMLNPNPDLRPSISDVLANKWVKALSVCEACGGPTKVQHRHGKCRTSSFSATEPVPLLAQKA